MPKLSNNPRANKAGAIWSPTWQVGVRVWVERNGQAVLGEGRAELLAAIARVHSISAAARQLGISYRHAWKLVQEVNTAAGDPLVEAAVGGRSGGGAQLTERGKLSLEVFERLREEVRASAAQLLQRVVAPPAARSTGALHLAAAISLQEVVGQLLTEYALQRPDVRVRAVYGASNELAEHIASGAPCDLFLSADRQHLDRLATLGLLDVGACVAVASNALAAIGAPRLARAVRAPRGLLSESVKKVALADPACPLGRFSRDYLDKLELTEPLAAKAVYVDNSRAVLAAIHSGRADAGLAFASDAADGADCCTLFAVDPSIASLEYWGSVVRTSQRAGDAQALLDFVSTPLARRCFRRCGLVPHPATRRRKPRRRAASSEST
jgi:molybdate transport system substrate-binding protein